MVICLEQGAQLMPLPLTISCFSKIQIGFTFLVPAHPGSPGKRAIKRVCVCNHTFQHFSSSSDVTCVCAVRAYVQQRPSPHVHVHVLSDDDRTVPRRSPVRRTRHSQESVRGPGGGRPRQGDGRRSGRGRRRTTASRQDDFFPSSHRRSVSLSSTTALTF